MVDDAITIPPVDSHPELRPEDLIWVISTSAAETLTAGPDHIVVLDLQALEAWQIAPILLASQAEDRLDSAVVAFGAAARIQAAAEATAGYDLSFLLRPDNLSDEAAHQYVYDSLVAVYAPFSRVDDQFLPTLLDSEETGYPKPVVSELDPAYAYPPFIFNEQQYNEQFALLNRPATEVRTEEE